MNNRIIYPFIELTNLQGKTCAIVADEIECLNLTTAEVTVSKDGVDEKKKIDVTVVICKSGAQYGVYEPIEKIGQAIEQAVGASLKSLKSGPALILSNGQQIGL